MSAASERGYNFIRPPFNIHCNAKRVEFNRRFKSTLKEVFGDTPGYMRDQYMQDHTDLIDDLFKSGWSAELAFEYVNSTIHL